MAWSVTINGHTYTDASFSPYTYVTNFPLIMQDVATVGAAASTSATAAASSATSASSSATAAAASAAAAAASAGSSGIFSVAVTITAANASVLAVGRQGATNPVLQIDSSVASVVTGLNIKGAASGGGIALSAISSATNESLTIDAKGSGTITIGGVSTGAVAVSRALTALSFNGLAITTSTGTLAIANAKTVTISNTLTLSGTDGSTLAIGAGGTLSALATTAPGTGVATALGVNVGSAGAVVLNGGALGTPSSGTLTSATGLPISTGLTGAGTGVLTALGINVGSAGAFVTFNGAGGTPSSLTGTNITGTAAGLTAGNVTGLSITAGKTLSASNTLTLAGTDGSTVTLGAGGTVAYVANKLSVFAATSSAELAGVISDETGSGALVFGTAPTIAGGTHTALTSLGIRSSGAAFDLTLATSEVLTAGRTLSIVMGDAARTLTFTGNASISGTNTGDQTTVSGNAGSATVLATARSIYGNNFDGSAALAQIIASTFGGTGNGFTKFSGPASTEKTFTLPNASATLLYDGMTSFTLGVQQTTRGSIVLANTAAGAFATTIQSSNSATAAVTYTLPTAVGAAGTTLTDAAGNGVLSWAAGGGISGFSSDGTTLSGSAQTVTTSKPILSLTQTWNAGGVTFTGLVANITDTASAATSLLFDLQKAGTSVIAVDRLGKIRFSNNTNTLLFSSAAGQVDIANSSGSVFGFSTTFGYSWFQSDSAILYMGVNADVAISREAAGVLAVRNSTNAQKFSLYNTWTDASNYERGGFDWAGTSNTLRVRSEAAGTGTARIIAIDSFQKAGAAVAGDIPVSTWALVRDTSGSTTKLIYNNAGTLMSVALT